MRAKQVVTVVIITFFVFAIAILGAVWYFYNRNNYVSVKDAYVGVDTHYIVGTATGRLTSWKVQEGSDVTAGDVVGTEQLPTGQTVNITAPADGQVLKSDAVSGEVISAGTMLGAVADLKTEYILANVKETQIKKVKIGQTVDIYISAYPNNSFTGTVQSIGSETAASASPLPTQHTSATFTKEVQRIPIKISLQGKDGKDILPHMNVSIRIHRNS